jgi:hypothetical protein
MSVVVVVVALAEETVVVWVAQVEDQVAQADLIWSNPAT